MGRTDGALEVLSAPLAEEGVERRHRVRQRVAVVGELIVGDEPGSRAGCLDRLLEVAAGEAGEQPEEPRLCRRRLERLSELVQARGPGLVPVVADVTIVPEPGRIEVGTSS